MEYLVEAEEETIKPNTLFAEQDKFQESMYEAVMKIYMKNNVKYINTIQEITKEKKAQYALFQDKKAFVQQQTEKKKQYNEQIKQIDQTVNNTNLLREEYNKRNENLPNKEKIFSISHLAERLDKEREELIGKIKVCNQIIEPKEFIKQKDMLEKEIMFLESIICLEDIEKSIIQFCNEFLKKVLNKIDLIQDKNEIIEWIYKIRYYALIPFGSDISLKDVLGEELKKVIKKLTKQAQKIKVWDEFTEDEELSYEILKEIFYSKIINLEGINIVCHYKDETLFITYYDSNIIEKQFEFKIKNIRVKKKSKLFI